MTPDTMLDILNSHGNDAGADYNDSDEVAGWFGWDIDDAGLLTISFTPAGDGGADTKNAVTHSWRVVPVDDQSS